MGTCSLKSQTYPRMCGQQVEGGDSGPLLSSCKNPQYVAMDLFEEVQR